MSNPALAIEHRRAAWLLCALAALQVLWYGWWLPPEQISRAAAISLALVWFALPLLAARADIERGLLVGALMALGYFAHGVMEFWANPAARLPAAVEIVVCIAIVGFAGWPSWRRAKQRRLDREASGTDQPPERDTQPEP
jgi:uncharacterized membrane protein